MNILSINRDHMFTIFDHENHHYLTVVTGGAFQYEVTIEIEANELSDLLKNDVKQIRLVKLVTEKPEAFEVRRIRPPISP